MARSKRRWNPWRTVGLLCFANLFLSTKIQQPTHISMESSWQGGFIDMMFEGSNGGALVLLGYELFQICVSIILFMELE